MIHVAIFDLLGPLAHFRQYYTNSSSLSYAFPPRTVLMGTVAAILGWERDSYHEELGLDEARFAVVVKVPVRRLIQTVNYVRTKKEDIERLRKLGVVGGYPGTSGAPSPGWYYLFPVLSSVLCPSRCPDDPGTCRKACLRPIPLSPVPGVERVHRSGSPGWVSATG